MPKVVKLKDALAAIKKARRKSNDHYSKDSLTALAIGIELIELEGTMENLAREEEACES